MAIVNRYALVFLLCVQAVLAQNSEEPKNIHPVKQEKQLRQEMEAKFEAQQYDEVVTLGRQGMQEYEHSLDFKYKTAIALMYTKAESPQKASEHLKEAIALFNKVLPKIENASNANEQVIRGTFYKGLAYQKLDNYERALGLYRDVVSLDRVYAPAWYNMGVCYERLEQTVEANRHYMKYKQALEGGRDEF